MSKFEELNLRYIKLHSAYVQSIRNKKLIQEEKEYILEKLLNKIEEIEEMKVFWRFFAYMRLVAELAFEIRSWKKRSDENKVQIDRNGEIELREDHFELE
jgi:hypothetical protein